MAKKSTRERARDFSSNFTRNLSNLRAGVDEDGMDLNRKNIAMFARIVGFALLLAGMLFLISTLQNFGLIK